MDFHIHSKEHRISGVVGSDPCVKSDVTNISTEVDKKTKIPTTITPIPEYFNLVDFHISFHYLVYFMPKP